MKEITLANSEEVAVVSDEDYDELSKFSWRLHKGYAVCGNGHNPMHWKIIGKGVNGLEPDHKNRNRLDNRRTNLRMITHALNTLNSSVRLDSLSGVKGIRQDNRSGKWEARIGVNYKRIQIGTFETLELAKAAYHDFVKKLELLPFAPCGKPSGK